VTVAILLATYNGEKYLQAQLDSFVAQTHSGWVLLWRDDGSNDGTRAIMHRFTAAIGADRCVEVVGTAGRIGATASFMTLLRAAADYPLLAFADQDDVWLPEKLARAVAGLHTAPDIEPGLYCARHFVVDAELRPRGESFHLRRPPGFPDALVQNLVTGCTVMLNHSAANLIAGTDPPPGSVHDWWSYILVSAAGGRIIADDTPTILYRQHDSNAIGVTPSTLVRAFRALRRGPTAFSRQLRAHVAALMQQRDLLSPAARTRLDTIATALNAGPFQRIGLVSSGQLRRQTWMEDLLLVWWLWLGRR
jgi:glycosyltransferase involved in cell wall biosynthesis